MLQVAENLSVKFPFDFVGWLNGNIIVATYVLFQLHIVTTE